MEEKLQSLGSQSVQEFLSLTASSPDVEIDAGDADHRRIALELATALGRTRIFGGKIPVDKDGVLPSKVATVAAQMLTEKMQALCGKVPEMDRYFSSDAFDPGRCLKPLMDQLSDRMACWAAIVAIEEALDQHRRKARLVNDTTALQYLSEIESRMLDSEFDYDEELQGHIDLLSCVIGAGLIEGWRDALAPKYASAAPWWFSALEAPESWELVDDADPTT